MRPVADIYSPATIAAGVKRCLCVHSRLTHTWVARQINDPYVEAAKASGYRSRAAFKLLEIQDSYRVIRRGDMVVDLGCAPGGWSQVARQLSGRRDRSKHSTSAAIARHDDTDSSEATIITAPLLRRKSLNILDACKPESPSELLLKAGDARSEKAANVIGIDLIEMGPIGGVTFVHGDFLSRETQQRLVELLARRPIDVVLSDMAHAFYGNASLDATHQMQLAWSAWLFAAAMLSQTGNFVVKVRYCDEYIVFRDLMKQRFRRVIEVKPPASRAESAECYLVCLGASSRQKLMAIDENTRKVLLSHGIRWMDTNP